MKDTAGPIDEVLGVVLAGGLARRMGGGDKPLKDLAGKTMLQRVIERLGPQVTLPMVLNANGDPERFVDLDMPVVSDTLEGHVGPLAGVLAGLRYAERYHPEARFIVTVPGDAPFFPTTLVADFVAAVAASDAETPVVLAQSGGRHHPVVGLWPVALADDLEAALRDGVRKVLHWTDRHTTLFVTFDHHAIAVDGESVDPFFNVNTPDDLAEAETILQTWRKTAEVAT